MDNQQESLEVVRELSWLAGIIDGEGTITIRYKNRKNSTPILAPVVSIVNTDMAMIDEIERILRKHNLAFWVSESKQTKNWKPRKIIEISGIKRLNRFLPVIENYLIAKKEECILVREWCQYRVDNYGKYKNHENYSTYDFETLIKIKEFHGHQDQIDKRKLEKLLKSSETTCWTSKDEDIVRSE